MGARIDVSGNHTYQMISCAISFVYFDNKPEGRNDLAVRSGLHRLKD